MIEKGRMMERMGNEEKIREGKRNEVDGIEKRVKGKERKENKGKEN